MKTRILLFLLSTLFLTPSLHPQDEEGNLILPTLSVSENSRYLVRENGKPFLWLGDTAWELFHRLGREEADLYLQTRSEQGFSIIQAVILAEIDGIRTPNVYGETPFKNLEALEPNEAYFKHVDYIVNQAASNGLFIGLLPTWGDKVFSEHPGAGPVIFNQENARSFGEFLGKRYKNSPVVWILGGDRNPANEEVEAIWRAMADGLRTGDEDTHLITYHPRGAANSATWFHEADWLDLNMYQSGHAKRGNTLILDLAEENYQKKPVKPFVEGEPAYEDIPVAFWEFIDWDTESKIPPEALTEGGIIRDTAHFQKGYFNAYDIRVHAYWNLLSGACGYTYGNNAIWQMFKPGLPLVIPTLMDWRAALKRPGAEDIRHIKKLFEARRFQDLIPQPDLVIRKNPKDETYIASAITADHMLILAYSPTSESFKINTEQIHDKDLWAYWYNPRDGKSTLIGQLEPTTSQKFTPPQGEGQDWVLMVQANSAGLDSL
ncbi:MAG: glycoside hydrolase family 140 protein [Bacteroidota bacterium]